MTTQDVAAIRAALEAYETADDPDALYEAHTALYEAVKAAFGEPTAADATD